MEQQGRIIQSTGKWYKVSVNGKVIDCRLPGKFRLHKKEVTNPIAVGDLTAIEVSEDGTGIIKEISERKNYLPRQATHGRRGEQILAANIDQAWVVQSIRQPNFKQGFVDRFLVLCEAYEVAAGIIINKMDLAKRSGINFAADITRLYESIGYPVLSTSIHQPETEETLSARLKKKTSVFIGPSGVGKTSLLNYLDPSLDLKVGEISSYSNKGIHTTTFARLIPLSNGGFIADTPGIRELGLVQIEKAELSLYFPEMIEPRQHCRFHNCTHDHEPDCGVKKAYETGQIDPGRYNSYLNMLESL